MVGGGPGAVRARKIPPGAAGAHERADAVDDGAAVDGMRTATGSGGRQQRGEEIPFAVGAVAGGARNGQMSSSELRPMNVSVTLCPLSHPSQTPSNTVASTHLGIAVSSATALSWNRSVRRCRSQHFLRLHPRYQPDERRLWAARHRPGLLITTPIRSAGSTSSSHYT